MKKLSKTSFITVSLALALLLSACRENTEIIPGAAGNYSPETETTSITEANPITEETADIASPADEILSITNDRDGTEEITVVTALPEIPEADYPPVTVEGYSVNGGMLTMLLRNRTDYDLGYIYSFNLYKDGVQLDYSEDFGICGTPDLFEADTELEPSFDLALMFGDIPDGDYLFEMNFSNYDDYFNDGAEPITVTHNITITGIDAGTGSVAAEDELIPDEILVDYEVTYLENGDALIKYRNNSDYELSYGLMYELYDNNGNDMPFESTPFGDVEVIEFNEDAVFADIAYLLLPGGENELTVYFGEPYFTGLESGKYTVVHKIYANRSQENEIIMTIPVAYNAG